MEIVINPHIRKDGTKDPCRFDALFGGNLLCVSEAPFFDEARELLKRGLANGEEELTMRREGAENWDLRWTVRCAAAHSISQSPARGGTKSCKIQAVRRTEIKGGAFYG